MSTTNFVPRLTANYTEKQLFALACIYKLVEENRAQFDREWEEIQNTPRRNTRCVCENYKEIEELLPTTDLHEHVEK